MERTRVIGHKISMAKFMWHPKTRSFSAEISELRRHNVESQIWNDAADCGFVMVSHRTGDEVIFVQMDVERDVDNDIVCWKYESYSRSEGKLTVTIYND